MMAESSVQVLDLGLVPYAEAYAQQEHHLAQVLEARTRGEPEIGRVLMLEHPAVITVSRRPTAASNLIATSEMLAMRGVEVVQTDRGGDITYHGPGQLVVYPILDLNELGLRLHEYMRLLEGVVIETLASFGVEGVRDPDATGVWVPRKDQSRAGADGGSGGAAKSGAGAAKSGAGGAKVCAMGVRVRRWISMHGLALNVTTNLEHFGLIVPCGLVGRPVTSLERELGANVPRMGEVKGVVARVMTDALIAQRARRGAERNNPPQQGGGLEIS
jgi:lipoyl(octanoyl) transferase